MDLIDREALMRKVESMTPEQFYHFIMDVCGAYLKQDAAAVVHAHWIKLGFIGGKEMVGCSKCHCVSETKSSFCKDCGARMDEGEDDG